MPLTFRCRCGRLLEVPDDWGGRTAACPGCRAAVVVPAFPAPLRPREGESLASEAIARQRMTLPSPNDETGEESITAWHKSEAVQASQATHELLPDEEDVPVRLSSRATMFYKLVLPTIWIGVFSAVTTALFFGVGRDQNGTPPPVAMRYIFLAITLTGAAFFYWTCMRLKTVWLEGGRLWVSNALRSEPVPLGDVETVREWWWQSPRLIAVRFRRTTGFGNSILFMPPLRVVIWGTHPTAEELRAVVAEARRCVELSAKAGPSRHGP
jgi:hypothetical protein